MTVIADSLLHSVILKVMTSMEAEDCAQVFLNSHWRFHGFPFAITSDHRSNWTSRFWTRLCTLVGIDQRLSTAFHPQTDGTTERWNQEVLQFLRAFISYAQTDWSALLPCAMLALNNRDSTRTGMSAFFVTHGYHLEPIQQVIHTTTARTHLTTRAEALVHHLWEGQEIARSAMVTAQHIMEHQAN